MRRRTVALLVGVVCVVLVAGVYEFGIMFECQYPFRPTLWLAEQTKTPDGSRVTDLIRIRSGGSYVEQDWHHCTWCDMVYPHVPHLAIKVTVDNDQRDFYLFDWQLSQLRLLPMTVRTAKVFPELIPLGYVVKPIGVGMNPQLYHDDEPCLIVTKPVNMKVSFKKSQSQIADRAECGFNLSLSSPVIR
jgi:hypothetical protein